MNDIDFERAVLLMSIMEKQANVSPMLTSISGEAAEELKGIAEDCRQNATERARRIREEEQVAEQHRLEAVKAHDEQNAQPRGPVQPAEGQPLAPGLPVPGPVGEPSPTGQNRDGIEDVQEPFVGHAEPNPVVGRRV